MHESRPPDKEGVLRAKVGFRVLLVSSKVRHTLNLKTQDRRLDRSDERQKGDCERTIWEGEMSTLFPSFLTPHLLIMSLSFYWLKFNKICFFMTNHYFSFESFLLFPDRLYVRKRSKSLHNSVQRSLLFLCFGSAQHHLQYQAVLVTILLHKLSCISVLRHFPAQRGQRQCLHPVPVPVVNLVHTL
jgi:hypothetical protein